MLEDMTFDVLAEDGGSVDLAGYGGPIDPEPLPEPEPSKVHYNQGIGNGAEGGDPGKSQPHGGSNDEGGRTPGVPMGKDPLTGSKGYDSLVGSEGCNSWTSKNSKSGKDPIVPDVVVLGKASCGDNKEINTNLLNFGCGSSSKSSDSRDCRSDASITFGVPYNPLHGSNGGSSFSSRGGGR